MWSLDYIPRGTRFGPLVGEVYSREPYTSTEADRLSVWKVSIILYYVMRIQSSWRTREWKEESGLCFTLLNLMCVK